MEDAIIHLLEMRSYHSLFTVCMCVCVTQWENFTCESLEYISLHGGVGKIMTYAALHFTTMHCTQHYSTHFTLCGYERVFFCLADSVCVCVCVCVCVFL